MASIQEDRVTFREMVLADIDEVLKNESRAYAFPWTRGIFTDCLVTHHDCRLICVAGEIAGHAVLSAAAGEAHLLNICIKRELQGQGLGRLFVHHTTRRAKVLGAQVLFLEVRPSNKVALLLYESLGFNHIGTRRDYYPADLGREDAFVLALPLQDEPT